MSKDEFFIVIKDKLLLFENELIEQNNIQIEENIKIPLLTQYLQKLNKRFKNAR